MEKKKNVASRFLKGLILCSVTLCIGMFTLGSINCLAASQVTNIIVEETEQENLSAEAGLQEDNGSGFLFVFLAILLLIIIIVVAVVISTATSTAALVGSQEVE